MGVLLVTPIVFESQFYGAVLCQLVLDVLEGLLEQHLDLMDQRHFLDQLLFWPIVNQFTIWPGSTSVQAFGG